MTTKPENPALPRRGGNLTVPGGLSVVYEEESDSVVSRERSPLPSQIAMEQGKVLTRQKPKFHTVQDLDSALHQAIEGKITVRNAWASREASDLLEGIIHTIENTLEGAGSSTDDYTGFTKAATVVEGCSKVWTSRVDSTYNQSNQMVRRLLRNEKGADEGEKEEGEENENGDAVDPAEERRRKRKKNKAAVRTVALDVKEINLDHKAKVALTQTGLNAQFRAITEKFDQGNAHGLLIHNAPLGSLGNYILDIDYSRPQYSALNHKKTKPSKSARSSRGSGRIKEEGEEATTATAAEEEPIVTSVDAYVGMRVENPPPFNPVLSGEEGGSPRASAAPAPSGRASTVVDPLLAVHYMKEERAEALANSLTNSRLPSPDRASQSQGQVEDNDNDNGEWDDGYADDWDEPEAPNERPSGTDVGYEARQLASGVAEVERLNGVLTGQLALEAEDPLLWCPLSQQTVNPLQDNRGELGKLHRGHHMDLKKNSSGTQPVKKAKKEKTIVFKLEEDTQFDDLPIQPSEALQVLLHSRDGALKQSTTLTKHLTPLGKEIVVDRDAPRAAASYTQSVVQRQCAEKAGLLLPQEPLPGVTIPEYLPYPIQVNDFFQVFCTSAPQWNLLRKSASGQLLHSIPASAAPRRSDGSNPEGEGPAYQDMPVEFFPGGAEVDYLYDAGDGPEDDDEADAYQHNLQLIAQFDAEHAEQAMRQSRLTTGSAASGELTLMEPLEMAKILKPMEATTPNQVDVSRLRENMWTALKAQAEANPFINLDGMEDPRHLDEAPSRGRRKGRSPSPQSMLKKNAAKVLMERNHNQRNEPTTGGKRGYREEEDDDDDEEQREGSQSPLKKAKPEELPSFSNVVKSVLPTVPSISSTGTLSPAFFFFSILFLANEHNVLLENVDSLDDLVVRGFAKEVS